MSSQCPYKGKAEGDLTQTHKGDPRKRRRQYGRRGRDWSMEIDRKAKIANGHRKPEEAKSRFSPRAFRESVALPDFRPPEL